MKWCMIKWPTKKWKCLAVSKQWLRTTGCGHCLKDTGCHGHLCITGPGGWISMDQMPESLQAPSLKESKALQNVGICHWSFSPSKNEPGLSCLIQPQGETNGETVAHPVESTNYESHLLDKERGIDWLTAHSWHSQTWCLDTALSNLHFFLFTVWWL